MAFAPRRALGLFAVVALAACITEGPPLSARRITDDDAGNAPPITVGPSADAATELGAIDPHGLIGVDPSHGPFNGGQARLVRGNGFAAGLRVWFGANEVATKDIIPIDPARAQVVVPAGTPGPSDVKTQVADDASTARVVKGAYTYEDFYADPSSGPTSGGTIIHLYGSGTAWASPGTRVTVDDKPCEPVTVISATELTCSTPTDTAGSKTISVTAPDKVSVVREGFVYADSDNGFRGGLAGASLSSHLKVLVFDAYSGVAIRGAFVLAGNDSTNGLSKMTDASGVAVFDDPGLGPKRSVTVAAKCYEPTTFVDVPVDSVTVYLTPVLSPICAAGGDPPAVGGRGIAVSTLLGELVWGVDGEFRRVGWSNVPQPLGPSEKLAAYVFTLSGNPTEPFTLPDASAAVRPDSEGKVGFPFGLQTLLGNLTLYALAGIEDRTASPAKFTAYAMGVVRGVSAAPGRTTTDIYVPMNIRLDHGVELLAKTPAPGPRGPDRADFTVAVEVERGGYAILPASAASSILPVDRSFSFVGLPALSGPLAGGRYIASALAGTGPLLTAPLSQVGFFASTSESIALDAFVPIPLLSYPSYGGAWNGQHLSYGFDLSGRPVDLTVLQIQSAGGLVTWLVVAPGGTRDLILPDLASAFPQGALTSGEVSISVFGGRIDGFDYGNVRYRQLGPGGFNAFSLDVFPAHYP